MKRTLLFTALSAALLFSISAEAQIPGVSKITKALPKVDLGVKLGANFQQLSGNLSKNYNGGVVGGVFVGVHKNKIGVQAEGLIKTVKYDVNVPTGLGSHAYTSASVNAITLEVPVLFEYKIVSRLWAQAGPEFSSILSAKNGSEDFKNNFNSQDFAGVIGLEGRLPLHINIGVRYVYGVTNINNESVSGVAGSMHNRTIQACLGFRFL